MSILGAYKLFVRKGNKINKEWKKFYEEQERGRGKETEGRREEVKEEGGKSGENEVNEGERMPGKIEQRKRK